MFDYWANPVVHFLQLKCSMAEYDVYIKDRGSSPLLNGPSPASFYCFFLVFSYILYNFFNNISEKCPSSKQCWDSDQSPLGRESPAIKTRPGLHPKFNLKELHDSMVIILRATKHLKGTFFRVQILAKLNRRRAAKAQIAQQQQQ